MSFLSRVSGVLPVRLVPLPAHQVQGRLCIFCRRVARVLAARLDEPAEVRRDQLAEHHTERESAGMREQMARVNHLVVHEAHGLEVVLETVPDLRVSHS